MTVPGVSVDGGRELRRALKAVDGGIADLKSVNKAAAEIVERAALPLVPRRSGALAGSIRSAGQAAGGIVRAGRKAVPYAGPIHFGWAARNIKPQPFLYDALDARRSEVVERYESEVSSLIKRHGLD